MNTHIALHFAVGMGFGTLLAVPAGVLLWRRSRHLYACFAAWLLLSYGGGGFAVVPTVLNSLGAGGAWLDTAGADLFVLHRVIRRCHSGGLLIGQVGMTALCCAQYAALLLAIRRVRGRRRLHARHKPCGMVRHTPREKAAGRMP